MPQHHMPGLLASTTQLAFGLAGFLVAILLLDSSGLAVWAQRLDVGPLRAVAAPATANIDAHLRPLGLENLRPRLIAELARLGWSDDPAALADIDASAAEFVPPPLPTPPPAPPPAPILILPPPQMPPVPASFAPTQKSEKPMAPPPQMAPAAEPQQAIAAEPQQAIAAEPQQATAAAPQQATVIIHNPVPPPPAPILTAAIARSLPSLTPLPPLGPIAPGHPRQVALVGDSMMAVGLSAVLLRTTATDPKLHMLKAYRSGTGLARPDVFDWLDEYPAMIGKIHPDVIIVALGANDAQGYVDADGETLAFGSDAWVASYRARVTAFMNLLHATGRQILWIGLPPMRSPVYDAHIAEINRITYTVVSAYPDAIWWNPTPYIGTPDGAFRDLGLVETPTGHRELAHLRAGDGIHLSDDGASLLSQVLMPWLEPLPLPPPPAPPPS